MRGIIFSIYPKEFYSNTRLIQEARSKSCEVELINPYGLKLEKINNADWLLLRTTGVQYDDSDLRLAKDWADTFQKPVINPPTELLNFRDKATCYLWACENSLSPIPTICPQNLNMESTITELTKMRIGANGAWVAKTCRGNQARGVSFIANKTELELWIGQFYTYSDRRYVLQPYLAIKSEYRCFFVGRFITWAQKGIQQSNQHFKLYSGTETPFKPIQQLPKGIEELAGKARSTCQLDYGAIDLIETDDGHVYLMEINSMPGFEKLEKMPGLNIAAEIVNYLQEKRSQQ